ncbi:uncharacterized protein V1510DRAFT_317412 [Dipodascopsis tothii]|uniref:uncharacterized protein n=1 Tax=Dipodascopsis tothii TaxID=44089 RepID=UPI0034CF26AF
MSTIQISVRHAGKKYDLEVSLEDSGYVLKSQLYSLTGVAPERQKILVKGGQLKDDVELGSVGLKAKQTLMMMGTAGELPKVPVEKPTFLEDLSDSQLAQATKEPTGLTNLGNTCYMNSSLQCIRLIPELQTALENFESPSAMAGTDLTAALRDLFLRMKTQTSAYYPVMFLNALRAAFPQFAEQSQDGRFKQQDAEEAYSQLLSVLNRSLPAAGGERKFVEQYMAGEFATEMKCDETDAEPVVAGHEQFFKLDCHITISTNFMKDGIMAAMQEKIEKRSEVLGRDASFTLTKKVTRLPKYLTTHFVRFYWRRDIQKKSKILRKVTFPFELDATDLCAPELRDQLVPVRDRIREYKKVEEDRARAAKRARYNEAAGEPAAPAEPEPEAAPEPDLKQAIEGLIPESLRADAGANRTGLYELIGVITHQGASADAGHYQCFAKQLDGSHTAAPAGPPGAANKKEEPAWWRFNDDKVTEVPQSRIETFAGGGEADSALILLYRAVDF